MFFLVLQSSADASIYKVFSHGFEDVFVSFFDGILSFEVYNHGALFGLDWCVFADINEGVDDPIEGVDFIVVDD